MTENATQADTEPKAQRKVLKGTVVSIAMDKSITVRVERFRKHPRYHKTIRVRKKFYAHDEKNDARVGDEVQIISCRPLSKTKRWRLQEITRRAAQV